MHAQTRALSQLVTGHLCVRCSQGVPCPMYHITDFEAPFESEKEDDPLLEHPQQQCLPVDDCDDSDQSLLTVDGRRYLLQVRVEAAQYRLIRTIANTPTQVSSPPAGLKSESSFVTMSHPIWNSKAFIASVLQKFKYTRKLSKLHRKQVSEARTDIELHFDIGRAVRTRQWWLEYCFGSPRSRQDTAPWGDECKDSDTWRDPDDDEEDEDDEDDDDDFGSESEKLDFDRAKIALGESMLASLHLCPAAKENPGLVGNAYSNGHQPQISFLCELDQTEVIRVLRFFRIWLRRDGYRPQLGVWLFGLLSLLDPVQTGDVYNELRVLFVSCNQARMRTLLDASALDVKAEKSRGGESKLVPSTCNSQCPSATGSKCVPCERVTTLRKQHSTLCLVMLIIGHFFGQKDLIGALDCAAQEKA